MGLCFFVQYFFMTGLAEDPLYVPFVKRAYAFLCRSQFDTECESGSFSRDKRKVVGHSPLNHKVILLVIVLQRL